MESSFAYFELMLLPVDDDGGDLLVHEQQDGQQDGRNGCCDVEVPGSPLHHERDQPASNVGPRRLKIRIN